MPGGMGKEREFSRPMVKIPPERMNTDFLHSNPKYQTWNFELEIVNYFIPLSWALSASH